jgi:hypothetical protein
VTTDPVESKPANEVTTDFGQQISLPIGHQDRSASACEPYRELIQQGLARGRNAMAIWQDVVSDHGFPGGYGTVKRFVRKMRGSPLPPAVGIILTASGEEAQVVSLSTGRSADTERRPRFGMDSCRVGAQTGRGIAVISRRFTAPLVAPGRSRKSRPHFATIRSSE